MELGLKDKVALVTGGSGEIGRACAIGLAREGAQVAICARDLDRLRDAARLVRREAGADVTVLSADLTRLDEITALIDRVMERFGRIDVLVNNAGASRFGDPLALDDDAWVSAMDLKYFGYVRCARAVAPHMIQQGWGRIINILGAAGKQANPIHLPGGAANAALVLLTKGLGMELARHGVLVNALSPSGVESERYRLLAQADGERDGISTDEALKRLASSYPIGRFARPEEVADAVCFLASERASFFVGSHVMMDGGAVYGI